MVTTKKKLKVKEVSVNMNSYSEGSVCFEFEKTKELPAPYYVFVGNEKMLKELEQRMKVNSVFDLKNNNVIAFIQNMCVTGITRDNSVDSEEVSATITSISYNEKALIIEADTGSEKIEYSFEKGSYALKAFMVKMGVVCIEELIGKTLLIFTEDKRIINLSAK